MPPQQWSLRSIATSGGMRAAAAVSSWRIVAWGNQVGQCLFLSGEIDAEDGDGDGTRTGDLAPLPPRHVASTKICRLQGFVHS
jgi:hypothetical protein